MSNPSDLAEIRQTFKAVFDVFETDPQKEVEGVEFDYMGLFTVRLARAGGANKDFAKVVEELTRPIRRALQLDVPGMKDRADEILHEAYARTVVRNIYGEKIGRVATDPFDPEIARTLFKELPAFFQEVKDQSESIVLFRKDTREADAGNS